MGQPDRRVVDPCLLTSSLWTTVNETKDTTGARGRREEREKGRAREAIWDVRSRSPLQSWAGVAAVWPDLGASLEHGGAKSTRLLVTPAPGSRSVRGN